MNNQFRARIDATGSRAYTLSEQTSKLLEQLDSPLDIVVLLDDSTINDSVVRQVDEVLRRYKNSSPNIEVQRINPANPESIDAYDALLRALIELYADEVAVSNAAIKEGTYQFSMLIEFASSTSAWAEGLLELSLTPKEQETFQTLAGALSLLGDEGHLILGEVDKAMDVTESQPLPNVSFARDILVAATGQWSKELAEVARWLSQGRSDSISEICKTESVSFQFMAATLAEVEMRLRELGELELGQIATQLALGEGALILSEDGATMIPSNLLFPEQLKVTDSIAVDHRFRGEQIISSAIRSLLADSMPTVVFVHAEESSLRLQQPNNADIRAVANVLETSRFNVEEWNPVDEVKPFFDNEPVVWVIVPPPNRAGLEPSPREKKLIEVVNGLIDENQSILLNIQPSLLPRYGHEDPWNRIAKRLGFSIDSERVLVERVASGQNTLELQRSQMVQNPRSEHTIANAVRGLQIFIPLPIAIEGGNSLINIQPSDDRWLDQIWERDHIELESKQPLEHSISIASAIEMPSGNRAIIVGSGGWFLTWATDRVMSLGGDQVALVNPGNIELFLTSVEWLSGLDEWIASGAIGNQTTRIEGLSETAYLTWAAILVLGLPSLLLTGAIVHSIGRQRR